MSEALTPESKEVLEFIRCGRLFCELYDRVPAGEDMAWVRGIHLALVDLYRAGFVLNLGTVEDIGDEPVLSDVESENIINVLDRVGAPFGIRDFYAHPLDLQKVDDLNSLACGSIADDLYEIQHDIRTGLNRWNLANERERIHWIWDWRFGFKSHWSRHAVGPLRAMLEFIVEKDSGFGQ